MTELGERSWDLAGLLVTQAGMVTETGDPWEPWRLDAADGSVVVPVSAYLRDLQASGRPASTQRSYALALLRWFRFLWTIDVAWDRATRAEARDFCRWMQVAVKPQAGRQVVGAQVPTATSAADPAPNPVTGEPGRGVRYAPRTRVHSETVLRAFYDFHREVGTGPMVNPFPLARDRRSGRAHAHHNPMDPYRNERVGLYRPVVPARTPRDIPDQRFNELFARLPSHRDRALIAFYVSTGARASELLGATYADADPGQQLITVIRKGSRALQPLPASPDAFVWLRLYQAELDGLVPIGGDQPLWWTLRRPYRALSYPAVYRMFQRVNAAVGANWGLHDLRHTAAHRMANDPRMPLTDVQWVLGHAHLSTTQIYLAPTPAEVVARVLEFHARRADSGDRDAAADASLRYSPETLTVLFGEDVS